MIYLIFGLALLCGMGFQEALKPADDQKETAGWAAFEWLLIIGFFAFLYFLLI